MKQTAQTVGMLIEDSAERGDATFLQFGNERVSYEQLNASSNRAANALRELGVRVGDKVCVMMNNAPEYLYVWFGLAKLGAVMVPVNVHLRGFGLAYVLHHCDAKTLVVQDEFLEPCRKVLGQPNIQHVMASGDAEAPVSLQAAMAQAEASRNFDLFAKEEEVLGILYTSGTTGPSKGAMLSHFSYLNTGRIFVEYMVRAGKDDVLFTTLPLFHCNAQQLTTMGSLISGARMALEPAFSASKFWEQIRRHRATVFNYIGAMLTMIYKQPERADDADNSIRVTLGGAAPKEIWREFERRFGVQIIEAFGLTETATVSHCNPYESVRLGSVGKPLPYLEARIVDENDQPVAADTPGEIVVRSKRPHAVMEGYYKMAEKTAEAMRGGWFHSGDRGKMDGDGYFYFIDRLKDCIRRRGENISSFELEKTLLRHSSIQEAVALAAPSELGEDDVRVVLVLKPDKALTPEEVIDFCLENMAYFMVPRYVEYRSSIPKTATQRAQKYLLRDEGLEKAWDREKAGYRLRDRGRAKK